MCLGLTWRLKDGERSYWSFHLNSDGQGEESHDLFCSFRDEIRFLIKKRRSVLDKWKPPLPPTKDISSEHTWSNTILFIFVNFSQKRGNRLKRGKFSSLCYSVPIFGNNRKGDWWLLLQLLNAEKCRSTTHRYCSKPFSKSHCYACCIFPDDLKQRQNLFAWGNVDNPSKYLTVCCELRQGMHSTIWEFIEY